MADVRVRIADLNLVKAPQKITTIGLGSCVGIALYDKRLKIVGLAHIMLPNSKQFSNVSEPFKFADLSIPILIQRMEEAGCSRRNLVAKIAGGASMFNFSDKKMISNIGARNVEMVKKILQEEQITIVSESVGGNKGRTMTVDPEDGLVYIKIVGRDIFTI